MIKAIIFDFDGVIAESNDIKKAAFARLFEKKGADIVKRVVDYHLNNSGVSRYEKFRFIYKEMLKKPLSDDRFNELCSDFSNLVVDGVVAAPFVKGAKEFLEQFSSTYECFVLSATPEEELNNIITKRKIGTFFTKIYGAPAKKKDVVKNISHEYHISPDEIVYIGDALSDYNAAIKNRVHFIARINNNETIFKGINCTKVKDLENLKDVLAKI